MYDQKLWKVADNVTVKDVRDYLSQFPDESIVEVLGESHFYLHGEKDKSVVSFDDNSLSEFYDGKDPSPLK